MSINELRKTPPRFPVVDQAIKELGTVKEFLEFTGIKTPTYYKMQAGKTTPTLGLIYKILDYTGLTFEDAFMEDRNNAQ